MSIHISESAAHVRPRGRPHIVVLDSDSGICDYLRRVLSGRFNVTVLVEPADLDACLSHAPAPDLVLLDWFFGDDGTGQTALNILTKTLQTRPSLPVVLISCSTDLNEIVQATRMGATDVLLKPFTEPEVNRLVRQYVTEPDSTPVLVEETPLDENTAFVRSSKRMREIESQCSLVARTDIPVLILGESGTGKLRGDALGSPGKRTVRI